MKYSPPQLGIVNQAISTMVLACKTVFVDDLECIILMGSAVKGDFIQGYSDFDFHVFLKPNAMNGERTPKFEGALKFQKLIGEINPHDFGACQFQIFFINSRKYPRDWLPPMKGTYKIVWGKIPSFQEIDDSIYLKYARKAVANVEQDRQRLIERFVDKPNSQLPTMVRLLGTYMKGHLYSVSILLTSRPKVVLNLKLDELISVVEKGMGSTGRISKFYEYVSNWLIVQNQCEYAQEAFKTGIEALDEINSWYHKQTLKE